MMKVTSCLLQIKGKAIRFATKDLRVFNSRDSMGVRGIKLKEDDYVVSLSVLTDDEREFILAVTENGFGKRSKSSEYRRTGRGGQGIANIEISKKNGNVITSFPVLEGEQLMLATDHGKIIRISVDGGEGNTIRVAGRKTQGKIRSWRQGQDRESRAGRLGLAGQEPVGREG